MAKKICALSEVTNVYGEAELIAEDVTGVRMPVPGMFRTYKDVKECSYSQIAKEFHNLKSRPDGTGTNYRKELA